MAPSKALAKLVATIFLLLGMCVGTKASCDPTSSPHRSFNSGISGTAASDAANQAQFYFKKAAVQALLARLEQGPLDGKRVVEVLGCSGVLVSDLVRTRILSVNQGRYRIGFSYFTLNDVKRIHAATARYIPSLVKAYEVNAAHFDRIFAHYNVPTVDRQRLAYVVLAGFGLNWDGLKLTEAEGYRHPEFVSGPGYRYSFWAAEDDSSYSESNFIWGSTTLFSTRTNFTEKPVDFTFSSYGDPYSDPRMNLPDVLYTPPSDLTSDIRAPVERIGFRTETFAGVVLPGVLGVSRARSLGPMLFALRDGPRSEQQLSTLVEAVDQPRIGELADLLVTMDYARRRLDGNLELTSPVLAERDGPMLDAALALNRSILKSWLKANYPRLRRDLSDITPVRQGVPFETAFTQIWHDVFGLTTKELISSGVIADPYNQALVHKGSFGVAWRLLLYQFDPG